MTSPLSSVTYVADGSTNTFSVPFPFLSKAHISCFVDGTAVSFSWPTSSTVMLANASASLANHTVLVQRTTPFTTPLVVFQAGGLSPNDLNTESLQLLYIEQENKDRSLLLDADGAFNAQGARIKNLGDAAAANDAVSRQSMMDLLISLGTPPNVSVRLSYIDPTDAAFGAKFDGVTDDHAAMQGAIDAALSDLKPIEMPAGVCVLSSGLTLDISANNTATGFVPRIRGAGMRGTYLTFGNGDFNGLSLIGSDNASEGFQLEDFTLSKGGYAANTGGDGLGNGLRVSDANQMYLKRVRALQFNRGFEFIDVQESTLVACELRFNWFGMRAQAGTFTRPNGLTLLNCRIGNNFNNGLDIVNPSAFLMLGGSIESNTPAGHTVDAAQQWGARFVFSDDVIEGTSAANLQGVYIENNAGAADVWYSNQYGPSGLILQGCSFQRHAIHTDTCVKFDTSGGFTERLVLIGNGFRGFGDYSADVTRPYVQIVTVSDNLEVVDLGNNYVDAVERPSFPAVTTEAGVSQSWARIVGITGGVSISSYYNVSGVTRSGVGEYDITFLYPLRGVNVKYDCSILGAIGTAYVSSEAFSGGKTTGVHISTADSTNAPADLQFCFDAKVAV